MKTAINFNRVTHIQLYEGSSRHFESTDRRFHQKPSIKMYERDFLYASKEYETIEDAEKDFARISANMGLKVI